MVTCLVSKKKKLINKTVRSLGFGIWGLVSFGVRGFGFLVVVVVMVVLAGKWGLGSRVLGFGWWKNRSKIT